MYRFRGGVYRASKERVCDLGDGEHALDAVGETGISVSVVSRLPEFLLSPFLTSESSSRNGAIIGAGGRLPRAV